MLYRRGIGCGVHHGCPVNVAPGPCGIAPGPCGIAPGPCGIAPGPCGIAPGSCGIAPGPCEIHVAPGPCGIAPGPSLFTHTQGLKLAPVLSSVYFYPWKRSSNATNQFVDLMCEANMISMQMQMQSGMATETCQQQCNHLHA